MASNDRPLRVVFGIFGHGNLAGIGQALQQNRDFRYYLSRNEQAMVHTAAFSKTNNRLRTFVCTSSIRPGATNMLLKGVVSRLESARNLRRSAPESFRLR
jgi:TPP-dependent trihydroxycyclohexane-1,2-dione (THcHDO) dehydratase